MFEEYGAMRAGGIVGRYSYRTEEAEREIVFSPYAGAMIGYPHEETERRMFYVGAMGAEQVTEEPPLYRAHRAISALIGGGVEPPYPSEETERRMFYVGAMGAERVIEEHPLYRVHRAISALIGGGVEPPYPSEEAERRMFYVGAMGAERVIKEPPLYRPEEILLYRPLPGKEVLGEKITSSEFSLERKGKKIIKRLGKLDIEGSILEEKYHTIMSMPIDELQPLHMLDIVQIRKFAKERGKEDWLTEIEKEESEYYEEISSFVKTSNRIMKRKQWEAKPMTIEEAKRRMKEFLDEMNRMPKEYKPDQVELKLITKRFMEKINLI